MRATTDGDAARPDPVVLTPGTRPLRAWQEQAAGLDFAGAPVIVVDQFEEVFRAGSRRHGSDAFVAALVTATEKRGEPAATARATGAERLGAVVVLGLRATSMPTCSAFRTWQWSPRNTSSRWGPMTAAELTGDHRTGPQSQ